MYLLPMSLEHGPEDSDYAALKFRNNGLDTYLKRRQPADQIDRNVVCI